MDFLKDDWMIEGTSMEDFENKLRDFADQTHVMKRNMDDFQFLNITDIGTELAGFPLNTRNLWKKTKASLSLKKFPIDELVLETRYKEETTKEALNNGLLVLFSNKRLTLATSANSYETGRYMPISDKAINTIANRIKLGGYNFSNPGLVRDLAIANYFSKPAPVYTVERNHPDSGYTKIFAVMSEKYMPIPQTTLLDIVKTVLKEAKSDLGTGECTYWSVDHSTTKIYIDFPECAKQFADDYKLPDEIVPGIMLETSDIGDCSLRVRGYFRLGGNLTYMESEFTQIHSGELNYKEMLNTIVNHIFPEYRVYPERLANLMLIDLVDASMSKAQKHKTMSSLYRDISKKIGLVKAIGKKREKALIDQLIQGINSDLDYTAYDVAETFLTLSSTIIIENKSVVDSVSKVVRNVLNYEFEEESILIA